ncbi:MAG: hypothetical protein ABIP51_24035 [Bacteroidia bacterium]
MCELNKKCKPCSLKLKENIGLASDETISGDSDYNTVNPVELKRTFGGTSLTKESESLKEAPPVYFKPAVNFKQLRKAINPSDKDSMRVQDFINRPNAMVLANKMANATTDVTKLIGRGKEALSLGNKEIAKLFFNKAKSILGEVAKKLSVHGKRYLKEGKKELANKCFTKAKKILIEQKKLNENTKDVQSSTLIMNRLEVDLHILTNLKKRTQFSADTMETIDAMVANFIKLKSFIQNDTEMRNN